MSEYIFGTGQLYSTPVGGGAPLRFGALQDVSVDFAGDIKMLYGQYQFALDVARGKTKIEWKAASGNIDVAAFNEIFFGGDVSTGDELIQVFGESHTIPATVTPATTTSLTQVAGVATATFAAPHLLVAGQTVVVSGATPAGYNGTHTILSVPTTTTLTYAVPSATVTPATVQGLFTGGYGTVVTHASDFYIDLGVFDETTDTQLVQVASGPATGEYSVSATGVYTFAAADTGNSLSITYLYESASTGGSLEINNELMGSTPKFQLILSQYYDGKTFTLILYSCVADKLSLPLKQDDHLIADLSGSAQANSNNKIGRITTTSTSGGGA